MKSTVAAAGAAIGLLWSAAPVVAHHAFATSERGSFTVSKNTKQPQQDEKPDELVPDRVVQRELNKSRWSLIRYENDPDMGFPPCIYIKAKKHRSRKALEAFKQRLVEESLERRNPVRKRRAA